MPERRAAESDRDSIRWGAGRRMEFIEFKLYWEGWINRGDLTRTFNISHPQASADLSRYLEKAPGNMDYDRSAKHYFATPRFKPAFIEPNAEQHLMQLRLTLSPVAYSCFMPFGGEPGPNADIVSLPVRSIEPDILRRILGAIKSSKAMHIAYQSMNRPESTLRWITPHALGFDGFRWHVRAYCHDDNRFKDFLLGRVISVQEDKPASLDSAMDLEWHHHVFLKIGPHPGLSDAQKEIIAHDYGMKDRLAMIRVRLALHFYLVWNLRLEEGDVDRPAKSQQIVLLNREEIQKEVAQVRLKMNEMIRHQS